MTENGHITAGTTTFEGGLNLLQKQLMMQSSGIYSDCSTGEITGGTYRINLTHA